MFARFDENPAMTLGVIKETKRYGRTDARTHGRTDNVKTVYPLQTRFAGGINMGKMRLSTYATKQSSLLKQMAQCFYWGPSLLGAEFVRGRVCQGPSLSGAEVSRNR